MKKSISIMIMAIILALSTMAQTSSERFSTGKSSDDPANKKSSVLKSNAQIKAEMNFMRMNTDAKNIEWFEIPGGLQVHYEMEGKNGRSFFDSRGRFQRSIITYGEKYLPVDIRKQVKSVYYLDYTITNVTEVTHSLEPGKTIYIIQLTNGKVWKKVRVTDEELEQVEEFDAG